MLQTTQGRPIGRLQIRVDNTGWTWEVADGEEDEMLSVDSIARINQDLTRNGVKVNKLACDFPNAQTLCG